MKHQLVTRPDSATYHESPEGKTEEQNTSLSWYFLSRPHTVTQVELFVLMRWTFFRWVLVVSQSMERAACPRQCFVFYLQREWFAKHKGPREGLEVASSVPGLAGQPLEEGEV